MKNASQALTQEKLLRSLVQTIDQTINLHFAQYPYAGFTGQQAIENDF